MAPQLVTLFGDYSPYTGVDTMNFNPNDDVFAEGLSGAKWDKFSSFFKKAQDVIGSVAIKTPEQKAAEAAAAQGAGAGAGGAMGILSNPLVLGGAAAIVLILMLKKR